VYCRGPHSPLFISCVFIYKWKGENVVVVVVVIVVVMADGWGSYHRCGIPIEFDGVLEHLLVSIEFRAM